MRVKLILIVLLFQSFAGYSQRLNPDAKIDRFSVNLTYERNIPDEVKAELEKKVKAYIDKHNTRKDKAFFLTMNEKDAQYAINLALDSTKYIKGGRKALSWTFIAISAPLFLAPPSGPGLFLFGLALFPRDRNYARITYSKDLQGPDYKPYIKKSGSYNVLFAGKKKRVKKHNYTYPYLGVRVTSGIVNEIDAFYIKQFRKSIK